MPSKRISSYQNLEVKRGSLSDTILSGTPCNLIILSRKALATAMALISLGNCIRCAYLLNLSTTTYTESPPILLVGMSVIKSMLICYQGLLGTGKGYNLPTGLPYLGFTR